jgi:hypothetical protein
MFIVGSFLAGFDTPIELAVSKFIPQGLGWVPDLPDARDYTYRHDDVLQSLRRLKWSRRKTLPSKVDLRRDDEGEYFTAPEDQGPLNCSAACAVLGLVEYFERRVRGRTFEGSKLFLYKVTRNRLQKRLRVMGDTGADLRTTLKVLVQFGVPPEEHWPYDVDHFDDEPSAFLYSLAKPFRGVRYFRLDEPNCDGAKTWEVVKSFRFSGSLLFNRRRQRPVSSRPGQHSRRPGGGRRRLQDQPLRPWPTRLLDPQFLGKPMGRQWGRLASHPLPTHPTRQGLLDTGERAMAGCGRIVSADCDRLGSENGA